MLGLYTILKYNHFRAIKIIVNGMFILTTSTLFWSCVDYGGDYKMVSASKLLLTEKMFPEDWIAVYCSKDCSKDESFDDAFREFGVIGSPGHVIQTVKRYKKESEAIYAFGKFYDSNNKSGYNQINLEKISDEQFLFCGFDKTSDCRAAYRFENYIVYFYFSWDEDSREGLSRLEILQVLSGLKNLVNQTLKNDI